MARAMERHETGEARVIPVILRPVDWNGAPFGKLQALPTDAKAVSSWSNTDEALLDIAKGIRLAVKEVSVDVGYKATIRVAIKIDIELEQFDERYENLLIHGLANFLKISPDEIHVKSKEPSNSVKITIDLPRKSAQELLKAYREKNPELMELILAFKTLNISPEPNKSIQTVEPGYYVKLYGDTERRLSRVERRNYLDEIAHRLGLPPADVPD